MAMNIGSTIAVYGNMMAYGRDYDEPMLELATETPARCHQPQFSHDGKYLAWGRQDGTVFDCDIDGLLDRLREMGLVD